jgi:protein-S-isoprenylcysteine O-methyltransferase Ste14
MNQKISAPVAIVIAVVVLLVFFGVMYKKYMYQPTYSAEDIKAKFQHGGKGAPPNLGQNK